MKPFRKKRDPVELIILLLGGFLVVMLAFFMARGDLDAYTEFLLQGGGKDSSMNLVESSQSESDSSSNFDETILINQPQKELIGETERDTFQEKPSEIVAEVGSTVTQSSPKKSQITPTPSKPTPASAGNYYLQVGAFSSENNANKMVAQLKEMGYGATIEKSSNLFKVKIYGFTSKQEASSAAQQIKSRVFDAFIGQ